MKNFLKKHGSNITKGLTIVYILVSTVIMVEQAELLEKSMRETDMIFEAFMMCILGL